MKRRVAVYLADEEYEWWLRRARVREAAQDQQVPDTPSQAVGMQLYLEARAAVRKDPTLPSHKRRTAVGASGGVGR